MSQTSENKKHVQFNDHNIEHEIEQREGDIGTTKFNNSIFMGEQLAEARKILQNNQKILDQAHPDTEEYKQAQKENQEILNSPAAPMISDERKKAITALTKQRVAELNGEPESQKKAATAPILKPLGLNNKFLKKRAEAAASNAL